MPNLRGKAIQGYLPRSWAKAHLRFTHKKPRLIPSPSYFRSATAMAVLRFLPVFFLAIQPDRPLWIGNRGGSILFGSFNDGVLNSSVAPVSSKPSPRPQVRGIQLLLSNPREIPPPLLIGPFFYSSLKPLLLFSPYPLQVRDQGRIFFLPRLDRRKSRFFLLDRRLLLP